MWEERKKESWGKESEREEEEEEENKRRSGKRKEHLYNTGGGRETEEYRKGNTVKLISSRCGDAWQDPLFVPVKLNQKRKI